LKTSASNESNSAKKLSSLLSSRRLSLYEVSRRSERIYGRSSPFFLPHNYYSELRRDGFSPSIYQLAALANICGLTLGECLALFRIDIEEIPRLQISLASRRTQVLNCSLVNGDALVPFLRERDPDLAWPEIAPLARLMAIEGEVRIGDDPHLRPQGFLYAKIGSDDAWAFPLLMPGSIVRADPEFALELEALTIGATSRRLFLMEHQNGFICSQIRRNGKDIFSPVSSKLPFAEVELKASLETRILVVIDCEIRRLRSFIDPEVPSDLSRQWPPKALVCPSSIAQLIRRGRRRMHLSLSETQRLSNDIAGYFNDRRYAISPSSLSDYEAQENPPRHLQKIITLCAVYGLDFKQVLKVLGIVHLFPEAETKSTLLARDRKSRADSSTLATVARRGLGDRLTDTLRELPVFLRRSVSDLSGISRPALEDFYWIGGERNPLHPALRGGVLAIVDRRRKKPGIARSRLLCQQPIFLLLKRAGGYLCAACSREGPNLVVHPYPQHLHRSFRLRNGDEAEIVGQIVTLVRLLS